MKLVSLQRLPTEGVSHNQAIQKQVMLQFGDIPNLAQFAQARFAPGQVAAEHSHADLYEIFFVEAGQGQIKVNGHLYDLNPGVCIAVEPGETHEVTNTGNDELILTYFAVVGKSSR